MGRPPCCDKVGIKKGPWTPEEDIILVSYIQEHGPGNWRSVPTNTGLSRCSKSCRLRWTNYLRPGIKRGNFTPHEEGMIIHLQALLGNKWAAIASYLPQRTDNDIKNYWNTHLKKKLKKFQASGMDPHMASSDSTTNNNTTSHQYLSNKSFNDRRSNNLDISINNNNKSNNASVSSSSTTYASSTENISRLLEGWMRASPKSQQLKGTQNQLEIQGFDEQNKLVKSVSLPALNLQLQNRTKLDNNDDEKEFDSILSFENLNSAAWDKSTCDSMPENSDQKGHHDHDHHHDGAEKNYRQKSENSNSNNGAPPLSFLEKWLLDENVGHGEEMMELSSPMF